MKNVCLFVYQQNLKLLQKFHGIFTEYRPWSNVILIEFGEWFATNFESTILGT